MLAHQHRIISIVTLFGLSLLLGTSAIGLRQRGVNAVVAAQEAAQSTDLRQNARARLRFTPDGVLHSISFDDEQAMLFQVENGDVTGALKQWIKSQSELLHLAPSTDESALDELRPSKRAPLQFGNLTVHRFEQTYRGHRVVGAQETVNLTVTSDGRVVGLTGAVLDAQIAYDGLEQRIDEAAARRALLAAFRARGKTKAGSSTIGAVELVAVPARQSMGYRGEILVDEQLAATVIISAVDGAVFGFQDNRHYNAFNHRPIRAVAYEMDDDPGTLNKTTFNALPGSTFGACNPNPQAGNCWLRMGDDRAAVYDFQLNNSAPPTIWLTPYTLPGGALFSIFTANSDSSNQFKTQNVFQKAAAALAAIDPLKSAAGWDHHPNAPFGVFTKAPLSIFTNVDSSPEAGENNVCDGALAWLAPYTFTNQWNQAEHPYVSNNYQTAAMALCSQNEYVVFHELGHYYDLHSSYGAMGTGLVTSNCSWDTPDEAEALAETIADMTAVYLYNKIYPGILYQIPSTSTPCSFQSFGVPGTVHSSNCTVNDGQIRNFQDERPAASAVQPCNKSAGYNQGAIMQAFWEYTSGRSCATDAPYGCSQLFYSPDRGMAAMLYAESLSNLQSYEQFFESMGTYLLSTYGAAHYNYYLSIMQHHGILP